MHKQTQLLIAEKDNFTTLNGALIQNNYLKNYINRIIMTNLPKMHSMAKYQYMIYYIYGIYIGKRQLVLYGKTIRH